MKENDEVLALIKAMLNGKQRNELADLIHEYREVLPLKMVEEFNELQLRHLKEMGGVNNGRR
jgi:uncharacterized protein YbgA (DUF1722 family)